MWVLDTDTLSLWLRGDEVVVNRVAEYSLHELAVTIITVEESLSGWCALIRQARDDEQLERAYRWLQQSIEFFGDTLILPFQREAIARFRSLRTTHRRLGSNDLRIAAIVLEHEATLVTRNVSDFRAISELPIEDWSRPVGD